MRELLNVCNQVPDGRATEAMMAADLHMFPFTAAQVSGSVFHINGAVLVCLSSSMESIYEDQLTRWSTHGITRWDARWPAVSPVKLMLGGFPIGKAAKQIILLLPSAWHPGGTGPAKRELTPVWPSRSKTFHRHGICRRRWIQPGGQGPQGDLAPF